MRARSTGLLGKFTRAFWLQVGLITVAAILGVFLAKVMIEETLVKKAILQEAEYYWRSLRADADFIDGCQVNGRIANFNGFN